MEFDKLKDLVRADWHDLGKWREEAEEAYRLDSGDQWDPDVKSQLPEGRVPVVFNQIAPVIDNVAGSEVKARGEIGFFPREIGDAQKAEVYSGAGEWFLDVSGAQFVESESFRDATVCGVGVTETRLNVDENRNGDPHEERVFPLEMGWDKNASARNLTDARRAFRVRRVSKDEALELADDENMDRSKLGASWIDPGSRGHVEGPDEKDYGFENQSRPDHDKDAVTVVEVQWRQKKTIFVTEEPDEQGQMQPVELTAEQKNVAAKFNPGLRFAKTHRWEIWRAVMGDDWISKPALAPVQKSFKWEFITGKRDDEKRGWYGLVRAMKDPQRWFNSFLSLMLFVLASNSKGGFIAEDGITDDHSRFLKDWAEPGAGMFVPDGALTGDAATGSGAKIIPKPKGDIPTGFDRVLMIAMDGITKATGVNPEMLGLKDVQQSGVLEYQRREAAMTVLASLFDSLRAYRIRHGKVILEYIDKYLSDGRVIRIVGPDGAKNVPLIREGGASDYDVIVDETSSSPNAKERAWAALQGVLPSIGGSLGRAEWLEILRYSPVPASLVEKLGAQEQEPPTPEQIEQQQMQKVAEEAGVRRIVGEAMKAEAEGKTAMAEAEAEIQKDLATAGKTQIETEIMALGGRNVEIVI